MKKQIKKIAGLSKKEMKAVKGGSNIQKNIHDTALAVTRNML